MAYMKKFFIFFLLIIPVALFAQCLDGNCDNGSGKFKFKNGIYTGDFLEGNLTGKGLFSGKRGYSYEGMWENNLKSGMGKEVIKKHMMYEGEFLNNLKHGKGTATLADTKYMEDIVYSGQWDSGSICGDGELLYFREVKYGKNKVLEKNHLKGNFINGIYQGRITSPYSDELSWKLFDLKTDNFKKYQVVDERNIKKLKNLATIEGDIIVSCECVSNTLIIAANSVLRQELSWWSSAIPTSRKQVVLNSIQREFDIIEWHARLLEINLNKQKLTCNSESLPLIWAALYQAQKESKIVRNLYASETAWNPKKKGSQKNLKPQEKWNKKISKKLKKY
ncbi:MAG: hypothetical protein CMP49_00805 [Flavobacteriales bacterium]|nr:hypothetical protein [Flavobacteriales bacterium]